MDKRLSDKLAKKISNLPQPNSVKSKFEKAEPILLEKIATFGFDSEPHICWVNKPDMEEQVEREVMSILTKQAYQLSKELCGEGLAADELNA